MNALTSSLYRDDIKKALNKLDLTQLQGKNILITGGLGLICSTIADLLIVANQMQELDIHIFIAARSHSKFIERYGVYNNISYIAYDATKNINFQFHADYIIHGASLASPDKYIIEPVETILSNIKGISDLLMYAKMENSNRVLYISSSEVYGMKSTSEAWVEEDYGSVNINSLRSSYAISKQAAELFCKAFYSEYNVDTVIVRPGHVFGPTASSSDKRVASDFAFRAAKKIPLILKSSGMQKRSYCYCVDVAAAILIVLLKGNSAESYNIGTKESMSIRDMAETYAKAGKVQLQYAVPMESEMKAFNPMNNSTLNSDKLNRLGFKSSFSTCEALEHTVEILRERLDSL